MKEAIKSLLIILILMVGNANAQYYPFPVSNATWQGVVTNYGGGLTNQKIYEHYLNGDTVINSLQYHKVYETAILRSYNQITFQWDTTGYISNVYYGCFREASRKIYYQGDGAAFESLLFDFNLNVGDTFPNTAYCTVSSIDSFFDGFTFRKKFNSSSIFCRGSVIEGIGSTLGFPGGVMDPFEGQADLLCFRHNGAFYYYGNRPYACLPIVFSYIRQNTRELKIEIYPNPVSNYLFYSLPREKNFNFVLLDILNRVVLAKEGLQNEGMIDVSFLNTGIYLCMFYDDTGNHIELIVRN